MSNPTDFPEPAEFASGGRVKAVLEPIVKASIIVPESACCNPYIPKFDRALNTLLSPTLGRTQTTKMCDMRTHAHPTCAR